MSGHVLFRFSGGALILGGISGVLAHILHLQYHPSNPAEVLPYVSKSEPVHVLLFAAVLLVLLGLPALLVRQHEKTGILGLTGFVLLYFGLVCGEWLHCILEIGVYPAMAHVMPNDMVTVVNWMYEGRSPYAVLEFVGGWFLLVGVLITGISMLKSGIFPRGSALLLLATDLGALLAFTPRTHWMVGGRWPVVFYLAFVAFGWSLTKSSEKNQARTALTTVGHA